MSNILILIDTSSEVDPIQFDIHITIVWNGLLDPKLPQHSIRKIPLYNVEINERHSAIPYILSVKAVIR